MTVWGPDENRAIEAVAALLEIFPREPGETDQELAVRMGKWAVQQGPNVRWEAMIIAITAMIKHLPDGYMFSGLTEIGLNALYEYNSNRWGGM